MKDVIVLLLQKYPSSRIYIFGAKPDEVSEVIPEQYSDSNTNVYGYKWGGEYFRSIVRLSYVRSEYIFTETA